MKKSIVLVWATVCALNLIGCGREPEHVSDEPNKQEDWGVTLEAQDITPSGLTILCHQSGGKNVSELNTGSYYVVQKLEDTEWVNVDYLPQEYQIAWTSEAWMIQKNNTTAWDVDWEWLYGKLPVGEYRIGKEIMNFRSAGDYDKEMLYACFEIQ